MLTQLELKAQLNYNINTGIFTRLLINKFSPQKVGNVAGTILNDGYIAIMVNSKVYKAHRLAWLYVYGYFPEIVDHVNGNPSDNRIANLREATHQQNMCNSKLRKNNTSGIKGVSWHKKSQKWHAQIQFNKIKKHIGYFDSLEDAKKSIQEARKIYHGKFAKY